MTDGSKGWLQGTKLTAVDGLSDIVHLAVIIACSGAGSVQKVELFS